MWKIDDYKTKYKASILNLFEVNYPGSILNKGEFFEWQNFHNPAGNSIIKLAINDKDEVVGYYCISPQRYLINEKIVLGAISLNTLVREDYRGQGMFTKLALAGIDEAKRQGIKFILGFPNQNSYHGFVTKLGFLDMGEMPLLLKPVNLVNLIVYKLGLKKDQKSNEIKQANVSDKDIYKLEKKSGSGSGNRVLRNIEFLKWRLNWPGRGYKLVTSDGSGWAVIRTWKMGGLNNGLIVDFKADKILKREVEKYFRDERVDQVGGLMAKDTVELKMLKKWGYIVCPDLLKPQPMRPVVRWLDDKVPTGFYDLKNWQLTMLDYDVG